MRKTFLAILSLLIAAALVLPACAKTPSTSPTPTPTPTPSPTKEPYKVGMTASMTGPFASGYLPIAEGVKIYFQKINDAGGIDGRKIELYVEDDRAEGGLSISNLRKFAERKVNLLIQSGPSALYAGTLAEAESANIPLIYTGIADATSTVPPTPKPLAFAAGYGTPHNCLFAALVAGNEILKPPYKLGILTVDSASNRYFMTNLQPPMATKLGLEPAFMQYFSPAAPDMTPFALKFKEANVDLVQFAGPAAPGIAAQEALRKLGWQGVFVHNGGEGIEVMADRVKDPKVVVQQAYSILATGLPEVKEVEAAAAKYKVTSLNSMVIHGWTIGQIVAEILKRTGYPATTDQLLKVMNNFKFSGMPLRWGIEWTSTDHAGPHAYQSWYWNAGKGTFVPINWIWTDTLGTDYKNLGVTTLK